MNGELPYRAATDGVRAEIARTDTKAGSLLAALGLPLAVLVPTVPGRNLPAVAMALVGAGAAGLVAAMVMVLLVILPRIAGAPRRTYLYWATCTPQEVTADLETPADPAEDIVRLSRIARDKYAILCAAIYTTVLALTALATAVLTAL
ncbi:Pycsar system effector family protein [Streptomyces sp. NPDC059142]|uniref:Pycsar system effector family protein n=1 Tax=Streptomyces sp. NPDC059142 TaxID=3346739 RepID=UPI0036C9EFAA